MLVILVLGIQYSDLTFFIPHDMITPVITLIIWEGKYRQ